MPSLHLDFLGSIWDKCFISTKQDARDEMAKKPEINVLNWENVFAENYKIWED